jgi:Cys-rich repeat protein
MHERFDDWTKELGAQYDRRGVVKTATVGVLGLFGLGGLNETALAKKKCKKNKDCNDGKKCKGGKCVQCKNNGDCKKGQKCKNNKCKKK